MNKDDLKALYGEFVGYLSQTPNVPEDKPQISMYDDAVWDQYNNAVLKLCGITEKDYKEFLITPNTGQVGNFIRINTYRHKLGGLISRLHAEYFSELPEPFSGKPSIVISQSQEQNQSTLIQILLDIQSKIDEKIATVAEGSKEKGFLQKLKGVLGGIKNVTEVITQILKLASEFGLTPEQVLNLLSFT